MIDEKNYTTYYNEITESKLKLTNEISQKSKPKDEIQKDINIIYDEIVNINEIEVKESYTKEEVLKQIDHILVYREEWDLPRLKFVFKSISRFEEIVNKYDLRDIKFIDGSISEKFDLLL